MPSVKLKMKLTGDDYRKIARLTPVKINRVTRNTINKTVRDLGRGLGGSIPRSEGVSVTGFRRVRVKRSRATVAKTRRSGIISGRLWLGGNSIAAKYGGKVRNVSGGARAGRHFFKGSFVATMGNGYTSIFKRDGKRLKEERIEIDHPHAESIRALHRRKSLTEQYLREELDKVLFKGA